MNKLFILLIFLYPFTGECQALAAHAGGTTTQGDSLSFTLLNGSATGGTAPYTYAWRLLSAPNGNQWCGNILNPTQAATQVLYTGVFSSPFRTAYKYELAVTDAASTIAKDTATVNVTYSTPAPPTATGSGFHYVTSADSIADPYHQMSPSRHDVWINGANTDNYASGGTKPGSIDIRNAFAVYPDARVFISAGNYFAITLGINKDSSLATDTHPWYLVPYGGQVTWFEAFKALYCWKDFILTGQYNTTLAIGNVNYQGHSKQYSFSSGTYGFRGNNGWRDIDAACLDFGGCDSIRNGEISFVEGPSGGSFFLLLANASIGSPPVKNFKIHDNYAHDSQAEMWYLGRTQSDPQQELDSIYIYNNRNTRSGLEDDQFGQNGQGYFSHNNVFWLSATNWRSPFDINQAFNNQRYYRKNGNKDSGNIWVGSGEQTVSIITNLPSGGVLTSDTNYLKKCVIFNCRGAKDIFIGSQNAAGFNFVLDSVYMGNRPNTYIANTIYNSSSNNFFSNAYAVFDQQNFPSTPVTVNFRHVRYDSTGGKTRLDAAGFASFTYSDTARVNSLTPLNFINTGFPNNSTFPNIFCRWVDTIYNTFKNEFTGESQVFQNQPYTFPVGSWVQHCGLFYQCLTSNQGHPPAGITDTYWQLMTWTKPDGTISKVPPDDLRLPIGDYYASQGIGLIDQAQNFISIPAGVKIVTHP